VLLISIMVGSYLTLQEIDRAMGEGELFRLFFKRPDVARSAASSRMRKKGFPP
jgi:hypothetical protein